MAVETNKETLFVNQIIGQKNDTTMIEEDFVVPDIKPDILNTIRTNGNICIYKKEIIDGKVKIDGAIQVYIMYLADDETSCIRSLTTTLDFSKNIDFKLAKEGMMLDDTITLKSIECRVLNGRKINVKAILDFDIKLLSNEEVEFVKEIENVKDVQSLNKTLKLTSLLGSGLTKTYAKDTIVIDNADNLIEIMKVNFYIMNQETKISYNKVLVKADSYIKIVYLTEDNRICTTSQIIPVMGFIDMQDVSDDNLCDVKYELKNLIVKPNNIEEHSIYVEAELEINCHVYQNKELNIIEDLYSPSVNLIYKQKQIQTIAQKEIIKDTCPIREKQFISEIGNHKIYDVEVKPTIIKQTVLKDSVVYEGEIELNFLFDTNNSSKIGSKNIILPFNFRVDNTSIAPNSQIETQIETTLQDFTVMSDENIDMKIDLEFTVNIANNENIQVIEEIDIDENKQNKKCSLIIYFVKKGDTLWNIAKKFQSTVSNIAQMNAIEDENKISVGQQLFIPRN